MQTIPPEEISKLLGRQENIPDFVCIQGVHTSIWRSWLQICDPHSFGFSHVTATINTGTNFKTVAILFRYEWKCLHQHIEKHSGNDHAAQVVVFKNKNEEHLTICNTTLLQTINDDAQWLLDIKYVTASILIIGGIFEMGEYKTTDGYIFNRTENNLLYGLRQTQQTKFNNRDDAFESQLSLQKVYGDS